MADLNNLHTGLKNSSVESAAGKNEGSYKTLGMALLEELRNDEAPLVFGEH